jgi:cytokinesis protein
MLQARKGMPITPSTKMKQLQWDKLPQQQVARTIWNGEDDAAENAMLQRMMLDGLWVSMEEDFKAKQAVINIMSWDFFPFHCE